MQSEENKLSELQNTIDFHFKDQKWLIQALTHRSFLNENKGIQNSNERLEFLGDAVLSFWVSQQIFNKFPELPEGKLTFIKTHLIRTETLSKLAQEINLGQYLLMSHGEENGGGRENQGLLENSFEALTGAIYCDQGINAVSLFLNHFLMPLLEQVGDIDSFRDEKSLLQEYLQAQGSPSPAYKLISAIGPDHQKTFTMAVYNGPKEIGRGEGKSKQEAEEAAAKQALEIFGEIK